MKDFILKLLGYSEEYIKFLITKNEQLITQTLNDANTVSELLNTKTVLTGEILKLREELETVNNSNEKLKQYITNLKTKLKDTSYSIDELSNNLQAINIDIDELLNSELDTED